MNRNRPDQRAGFYSRLVLAVLGLVLIGGCHKSGQPRLRVGSFFGSPLGIHYLNPDNLGNHHYAAKHGEKNGMVYTCRGGFIDIGHLREAADRTAYLTSLINKNLLKEKTEFTFHVIEPSMYRVTINYPPDWHTLSKQEKESIAYETSVQLAQYIAHTSLIWHEIITWFGFSSSWVFSENISSFSWEDPYSDLLGVTLAGQVLREKQPYNRTMTKRINSTLEVLDVQSPEAARYAARQIDGKWYSGGFYFFVDMKKRNFDIGLGGRHITPWLVPGMCPDAKPYRLQAPVLKSPTAWGFDVDLEIHPLELEKKQIYEILNVDQDLLICPAMHFPVLLEEIQRQARQAHHTDKTTILPPPELDPTEF